MHSRALAVAQHLLDRLLNVYGEPEVGDVNEFMREYTYQLTQFDAEELSLGCRIILATFKYRRWPRPAECREACLEARKRLQRQRAAAENPAPPTNKRTIWFLSKEVDRLQWRAWIDRLARHGDTQSIEDSERSGAMATHSLFPKENDGLEGFISAGPFDFDRKKEAHATGWVTVHDTEGRQIR